MKILIGQTEEAHPVQPDPKLLRGMLVTWRRILANRARWLGNAEDERTVARDARRDLKKMQFFDAIFAETHIDSLQIDYSAEDLDTDLARMPWEFLFSLARDDLSLPCFRNIDYEDKQQRKVAESPRRLLIIESCPGSFKHKYEFTNEPVSVGIALGAASDTNQGGIELRVIGPRNATFDRITQTVTEFEPDIIHITGIDGHEGALLKGRAQSSTDGFYLLGRSGKEELLSPVDLADGLLSGAKRPRVVLFDCHYSGVELARACVNRGAINAIGFYSTFDDEPVEQFVFDFYKQWRLSGWNTPRAFREALRLSNQHLGAIMWRNPKDGRKILLGEPEPEINMVDGGPTINDVSVDVAAKKNINYCSLHNNRSPFKHFSLQNSRPGAIDLAVKVEMDIGNTPRPLTYVDTVRLTDRLDLKKMVRIPLIWSAAVKQEAVRTTLRIEVKEVSGTDAPITQNEFVTLLPYDEWQYDGDGQAWLPSFVLPRDPAISGIVDGAQHLLPVLFDNPSASFDGYQSVEVIANEPLGASRGSVIDLQVRALWSHISYEISPNYINPPPSYTVNSQRLRPPSEILDSRRGTCIDLSLLMCACLEYVEVLPVIFLLDGHAFCGYWRSLEAHGEFRRASMEGARAPGTLTLADHSSETPWLMTSIAYDEIMFRINRGDLVPLEATLLCRRGGMGDAMSEGLVNLRSQHDFLGMIDISISRQHQVRPLPLH